MKQYKAVAGPKVVSVDKGDSQTALNLFADIINQQAVQGWEYHSMETITIQEKPGCMENATTTNYYMLIFYKEV